MDGSPTLDTLPHDEGEVPQEPSRPAHELTLPITRVKKIIKQDGEVKAISNDANYAIAKAAEMLLADLVEASSQKTLRDNRILLSYADVAETVHGMSRYGFLRDVAPKKAPAAELLRALEDPAAQSSGGG